MHVLKIDSSISGAESISCLLTGAIVDRLTRLDPDLSLATRDVADCPVAHRSYAHLRAELAAASNVGSPAAQKEGAGAVRSVTEPDDDVSAELKEAQAVLDELMAADIVVIGTPMYNFGIPSQLKTWLDCLFVPGVTFDYTPTGPVGRLRDRTIIIASARGGIYTPPSPSLAMDFQESYLAATFRFLGLSDIRCLRAEGVSMGPENRSRALDDAMARIERLTLPSHTRDAVEERVHA